MSQINIREICLLGTTTVTTTGAGPDINLIQGWQAATITMVTSSATGTLPTLNMRIQYKLGQPQASDTPGNAPTGTAIYSDLCSLVQVTSTVPITTLMNIVTCGAPPTTNNTLATTTDWALQNQTMLAREFRVGPLGGIWRVTWVIGGTTPQFIFNVVAQLVPFNT